MASFPSEVFAPKAGPAGTDTPAKPLPTCLNAPVAPAPAGLAALCFLPAGACRQPRLQARRGCLGSSPSPWFSLLDLTRFCFRGGLKLSQSLPEGCWQRSSAVCPTGCTWTCSQFLSLTVIARAFSEFWKAKRNNVVLMLG